MRRKPAISLLLLAIAIAGGTWYVRSRPRVPPPETIAGAFIRNVEGRIAALEASAGTPAAEDAAELREVLRLGRQLLTGTEVAS